MAVHLSTTARAIAALLEAKGAGDLIEFVLDREDAGLAYREIANQLYDAIDVRVSHESVRSWAKEWRHQTGRKAVAA